MISYLWYSLETTETAQPIITEDDSKEEQNETQDNSTENIEDNKVAEVDEHLIDQQLNEFNEKIEREISGSDHQYDSEEEAEEDEAEEIEDIIHKDNHLNDQDTHQEVVEEQQPQELQEQQEQDDEVVLGEEPVPDLAKEGSGDAEDFAQKNLFNQKKENNQEFESSPNKISYDYQHPNPIYRSKYLDETPEKDTNVENKESKADDFKDELSEAKELIQMVRGKTLC